MALTFTQDDLNRIKEAFLTGATEVTVGDRTIKYRPQKDLVSLMQVIQEAIDGVPSDVDDLPNIVRPTFSRGGE